MDKPKSKIFDFSRFFELLVMIVGLEIISWIITFLSIPVLIVLYASFPHILNGLPAGAYVIFLMFLPAIYYIFILRRNQYPLLERLLGFVVFSSLITYAVVVVIDYLKESPYVGGFLSTAISVFAFYVVIGKIISFVLIELIKFFKDRFGNRSN